MQEGQLTNHDHVGIIQTGLNVKDCIDRCTNYLRSRPFDVDGDVDAEALESEDDENEGDDELGIESEETDGKYCFTVSRDRALMEYSSHAHRALICATPQ